jgi:sterol desaturase/sphingolipid hydroxylase (fatty acid hydroxylase superfamily)
MDDSQYGIRDRRGHWRAFKPLGYPPLFVWPAQPKALARWLFGHDGYMLPWNLFYASIALLYWFYLTPSLQTMKTLTFDWPIYLLICNAVILFLVTGGLHLYLYIQRAQGTQFKHNAQWPSKNNSAFLFGNQNVDNFIWTFASAVPIWTAFEVLLLWCFANGYIPFVSFNEHPIYLAVLFFLVPIWRGGLHFYLIHRLLHIPTLYRWVHKLHYNNVNPGPWTGLSMHPVEQLFFYSSVLIYVIVPAHPLIVVFEGIHASLSPGIGHSGFDRIVLGKDRSVTTYDRFHYLHHKYFECNYGLALIPLDKWFGTFHDGTEEADKRMNERFIGRSRKYTRKNNTHASPAG